jgi:hypothetical protein
VETLARNLTSQAHTDPGHGDRESPLVRVAFRFEIRAADEAGRSLSLVISDRRV